MAVAMPSTETLTIITGIGGWAGVWHAVTVYFDKGPLMIDRAAKMAFLPIFWGSVSIVVYVGGINIVNLITAVLGAMFHPIPFVINLILISLTISTLSAIAYIKEAFEASAEAAATEIAAEIAVHYEDEGETETEEEEMVDDLDKPLSENENIEESPLGDVVPTAIVDPAAETQRLDAELDTYAAARAAMHQTVQNAIDAIEAVAPTNTEAAPCISAICVSPEHFNE
jgi:hypothetical protein